MKILVTGGAGFIGSHVSEILLARGDCVVVVDEMNSYYDPKHKKANLAILRATAKTADHFRFYEEDVADLAAMDKIFEAEQPEMVCHLAARAGVRPSLKVRWILLFWVQGCYLISLDKLQDFLRA